eukprot:8509466-Lingulodinium_polyedra.AAC.1
MASASQSSLSGPEQASWPMAPCASSPDFLGHGWRDLSPAATCRPLGSIGAEGVFSTGARRLNKVGAAR